MNDGPARLTSILLRKMSIVDADGRDITRLYMSHPTLDWLSIELTGHPVDRDAQGSAPSFRGIPIHVDRGLAEGVIDATDDLGNTFNVVHITSGDE